MDKGILLTCPNCRRKWKYAPRKGKAPRAWVNCPSCYGMVRVNNKKVAKHGKRG